MRSDASDGNTDCSCSETSATAARTDTRSGRRSNRIAATSTNSGSAWKDNCEAAKKRLEGKSRGGQKVGGLEVGNLGRRLGGDCGKKKGGRDGGQQRWAAYEEAERGIGKRRGWLRNGSLQGRKGKVAKQEGHKGREGKGCMLVSLDGVSGALFLFRSTPEGSAEDGWEKQRGKGRAGEGRGGELGGTGEGYVS
eukprot:353894-Chlamydomonas_euryale.AAC.5